MTQTPPPEALPEAPASALPVALPPFDRRPRDLHPLVAKAEDWFRAGNYAAAKETLAGALANEGVDAESRAYALTLRASMGYERGALLTWGAAVALFAVYAVLGILLRRG